MAEVRIESLVKTYPNNKGDVVTIVKGIDLTIADHEFLETV